ncbi:MAG: hypothetical protein WEB33_11980 [Bacteroidota bacterium]
MKRILKALGIVAALAAVTSFFLRDTKETQPGANPPPAGKEKKTRKQGQRKQKKPGNKTIRRRRHG